MKIDALPLTPWSEIAVTGKAAKQKQLAGTHITGPDSENDAPKALDSKELLPSTVTYSPASLKAESAKNALYGEVAENNRNAINPISPIPRSILDGLKQLISER
jgi:hypothetical protein